MLLDVDDVSVCNRWTLFLPLLTKGFLDVDQGQVPMLVKGHQKPNGVTTNPIDAADVYLNPKNPGFFVPSSNIYIYIRSLQTAEIYGKNAGLDFQR